MSFTALRGRAPTPQGCPRHHRLQPPLQPCVPQRRAGPFRGRSAGSEEEEKKEEEEKEEKEGEEGEAAGASSFACGHRPRPGSCVAQPGGRRAAPAPRSAPRVGVRAGVLAWPQAGPGGCSGAKKAKFCPQLVKVAPAGSMWFQL